MNGLIQGDWAKEEGMTVDRSHIQHEVKSKLWLHKSLVGFKED